MVCFKKEAFIHYPYFIISNFTIWSYRPNLHQLVFCWPTYVLFPRCFSSNYPWYFPSWLLPNLNHLELDPDWFCYNSISMASSTKSPSYKIVCVGNTLYSLKVQMLDNPWWIGVVRGFKVVRVFRSTSHEVRSYYIFLFLCIISYLFGIVILIYL